MALFDTTFSPYVPFGSRNLSAGSVGADVAVVQAAYDLMATTMNPLPGPLGPTIAITGHFNAETTMAVRAIQSYFGLSVDGVVGPNTFFVFGQGVGSHTTYGGPVYGSRQLETGMSGGDVTILQNRLNGFRYAALVGHPANGVFDAGTAAAVRAFKSDAEANGDTGFPSNDIAGYGFYDASWIYTFAGGRAIETGRNGFDVVFLQVLLSKLGFYSGRFDGYYGGSTVTAVRNFQASQGVSVDGVVGPVTFYRLGRQNTVAAPSPLAVAWPVTPTPAASVLSVALTSSRSDLHPYGEASHVINEAEGFESLDVIGNFLPDPTTFGSSFSRYAFVLVNPSTSAKVTTQVMTKVTTGTPPSDWAGTYSPGVKTIPNGVVTVYPSNATGSLLGPAALHGDLRNGH